MRGWIIVSILSVGCSRPTPELGFTAIGPRDKIRGWFEQECGLTGKQREAFVVDPSKSHGDYSTEYIVCSHVGALDDVTLELRSDSHDACGVRLGPARLTKRIDANIVLPWFRDQALAERVATALATEQGAVVDGLTVGMIQNTKNLTNFMLVIDGCGHRPVDATAEAPHIF